MAKKVLIESPPPSSEEESSSCEEESSSSGEETQLDEQKSESNSLMPTKAEEQSEDETDEEDEESDENNETEEPNPKSEKQNSPNKTHEEQDGFSNSEEESDEESKEDDGVEGSSESEEESKDDTKVEVPKPSSFASPLKTKTENGDTKKDFFGRLWSFEDEIILLNSILEFRLNEGKEVDSKSLKSFCEFLKGKLSFTNKPEHKQVSAKIKALKKKYTGVAVARFTKEHDIRMKDFATQVWVSDVKTKPMERNFSLLEEEVSRIFGPEMKLKFVPGDEECEALEEKLRATKRLKVEQDLKRIDLINETFKLINEGIRKSYGF